MDDDWQHEKRVYDWTHEMFDVLMGRAEISEHEAAAIRAVAEQMAETPWKFGR